MKKTIPFLIAILLFGSFINLKFNKNASLRAKLISNKTWMLGGDFYRDDVFSKLECQEFKFPKIDTSHRCAFDFKIEGNPLFITGVRFTFDSVETSKLFFTTFKQIMYRDSIAHHTPMMGPCIYSKFLYFQFYFSDNKYVYLINFQVKKMKNIRQWDEIYIKTGFGLLKELKAGFPNSEIYSKKFR